MVKLQRQIPDTNMETYISVTFIMRVFDMRASIFIQRHFHSLYG